MVQERAHSLHGLASIASQLCRGVPKDMKPGRWQTRALQVAPDKIAAAMFLSPHTVGYDLRHIYPKLGVNSRVELTRLLTQREQQPT